ncbi:hypothetical protein Tco_0942006 [Tanacetum coccineum]|uniref:Uncharacterized protein n=1 Tax=Tanacetum coccineum TaxID=301880 RepID=A0ABQ5DSG9_9ASTR
MVDEDKESHENILSTEDVLSTDKEGVSTDMEKVSTDRPIVSIVGSKVSTDRQIEGTDEQVEGTEEHNEGTEEKNEGTKENFEGTEEHIEGTKEQVESTDGHKKGTEEEIATQATQTSTQTPTSKIFGDDETIAKVLLNMSHANRVSRDKMRKVEKIDQKDEIKIRKLISIKDERSRRRVKAEVQDESKEEERRERENLVTRKMMKSVKEDIFKHLLKIMEAECLGTKPQTDQAEHIEEINQNVVIRSNGQNRYFSSLMRVLSIFDREDLNAVYQLVMDRFQDEMPEGFHRVLWGDLMILFNPDDKDEFWNSQLDWIIVSWKLHSSSGVHTLVTETGVVIHMLVEKSILEKGQVLMQML